MEEESHFIDGVIFMGNLEVRTGRKWRKRMGIIGEKGENLYIGKSLFEKPPQNGWNSISLEKWISLTKEVENVEKLVDFELFKSNERDGEYELIKNDNSDRYYFRFEPQIRGEWVEKLSGCCTQSDNNSVYKETIEIIKKRLKQSGKFIPPEEVEIDTETNLGSGASGMVKVGLWKVFQKVAVKLLLGILEMAGKEEEEFLREIEMLSRLQHPHIVQMFGYTNKGDATCLVLDYVQAGSLCTITDNPNIKLSLLQEIDICLSIAKGMQYIHGKKIIHRDLKPGNILVDNLSIGTVKICDFGLSLKQKSKEKIFGTAMYAAPELPNVDHTDKVDVYSFAIVVYELIFRRLAWPETMMGAAISKAVENGERPEITGENSKHPLVPIIQICWNQDPWKRPKFDHVANMLSELRHQVERETKPFEAEQRIEFCFMNNGGILKWNDFIQILKGTLGANEETVEEMAGILYKDGEVHFADWQNVLQWFSPLISENNALGGLGKDRFSLSEMSYILGAPWFFGYMSAGEAEQELMKSKEPQVHLVRFSGTAKMYALSAKLTVENGPSLVSHWRVGLEKNAYKDFSVYVTPFNDLKFNNFETLFKYFVSHKLPNSDFTLKTPMQRPPVERKVETIPDSQPLLDLFREEQEMEHKINSSDKEFQKAEENYTQILSTDKELSEYQKEISDLEKEMKVLMKLYEDKKKQIEGLTKVQTERIDAKASQGTPLGEAKSNYEKAKKAKVGVETSQDLLKKRRQNFVNIASKPLSEITPDELIILLKEAALDEDSLRKIQAKKADATFLSKMSEKEMKDSMNISLVGRKRVAYFMRKLEDGAVTRLKTAVESWDPEIVDRWLKDQGFSGEIVDALSKHQMDGVAFVGLTDDDLIEVGIKNPTERKNLIELITKRKQLMRSRRLDPSDMLPFRSSSGTLPPSGPRKGNSSYSLYSSNADDSALSTSLASFSHYDTFNKEEKNE